MWQVGAQMLTHNDDKSVVSNGRVTGISLSNSLLHHNTIVMVILVAFAESLNYFQFADARLLVHYGDKVVVLLLMVVSLELAYHTHCFVAVLFLRNIAQLPHHLVFLLFMLYE